MVVYRKRPTCLAGRRFLKEVSKSLVLQLRGTPEFGISLVSFLQTAPLDLSTIECESMRCASWSSGMFSAPAGWPAANSCGAHVGNDVGWHNGNGLAAKKFRNTAAIDDGQNKALVNAASTNRCLTPPHHLPKAPHCMAE